MVKSPSIADSDFMQHQTRTNADRSKNSKKHAVVVIPDGEKLNDGQYLSKRSEDLNGNQQLGFKRTDRRYLIADYGILGNSDDEDSSKWAAAEIRKVPLRSSDRNNLTQQQPNGQNASVIATVPKAVSFNVNLSQSKGIDIEETIPFKKYPLEDSVTNTSTNVSLGQIGSVQATDKNLQSRVRQSENTDLLSTIVGNQTVKGRFLKNDTANKETMGKPHNSDNDIRLLPSKENASRYPQNVTYGKENEIQGNYQIAPQNAPSKLRGNEGAMSAFAPNASIATSTSQRKISNTTTEPKLFIESGKKDSAQNITSGKVKVPPESNKVIQLMTRGNASAVMSLNGFSKGERETHDQAPSLSINFTRLRSDQSFDVQMTPFQSSKVSYKDNHIHIQPQNVPHPFRANMSKGTTVPTNQSRVINKDFYRVKANGRQHSTLLERLNSDIVAAGAEPLTVDINSERGVSNEAFQEEPAAGRTFAGKVLEAALNDGSLNSKGNQDHESQSEVQQDESLARALNASSVSSIIYSANQALFDTDNQVFSKKSAQGKLSSKRNGPRNKRGNYLHHLVKHHHDFGKNAYHSKLKHKETPSKAVARQVINLGNHYLWFGAQNSVDANGYPRQNTAAVNTVRRDASKLLNSEKALEESIETKGYKALQNALSSMEFTQEGQAGSDFQYGTPLVNKYWKDAHLEKTPTRVVFQDGAGRSVHQGLVHISKLNQTISADNGTSEVNSDYSASHDQGNREADKAKTHRGDESNMNSAQSGQQESGNKSENSTETTNDKEISAIVQSTNSTTSNDNTENQSQEMKATNQSEHQTPIIAQPSVVVKQLSTSTSEPETYHVIVRDEGKKITNEKGHVTVIISGPTAKQATMGADNTLLIPQTDNLHLPSENMFNDNTVSNTNQGTNSHRNESISSMLSTFSKSNDSLSLLQDDAVSALKVSEGIEKQFGKGENLNVKISAEQRSGNKTGTDEDSPMQQQHHFVQIGQDLKDDVDGLQMEEVTRPGVQEEQHQEKEKPLEPFNGEYLDQLGEQTENVPTLNIVLDPTHKIAGSMSVGGRVVPLSSTALQETKMLKQKLDCHTDPKNTKRTLTVLTCKKKHSLYMLPEREAYLGNQEINSSPPLQLDQVMNVLNNQVKATINNEMKHESKDIQKMLTGMSLPSSTLMDVDDDYPDSESPQRSSIGPDESYTSTPVIERQHRPFIHQRHHFGFVPHLGFFNHFGLSNRRHYWRNHRHHNPFLVMAHKDNDEGFWDYQHNIFIPRASNFEDSDGEEEERNVKKWTPWSHQGHRRGNWFMARPTFRNPRYTPGHRDLFHLRLPTIFGRSGPWKPSMFFKQERGAKRTAVVHKTMRGDRDMCKPIIDGPSPPLKGEWEYLGKVLSSCPCRQSDSEW